MDKYRTLPVNFLTRIADAKGIVVNCPTCFCLVFTETVSCHDLWHRKNNHVTVEAHDVMLDLLVGVNDRIIPNAVYGKDVVSPHPDTTIPGESGH